MLRRRPGHTVGVTPCSGAYQGARGKHILYYTLPGQIECRGKNLKGT